MYDCDNYEATLAKFDARKENTGQESAVYDNAIMTEAISEAFPASTTNGYAELI